MRKFFVILNTEKMSKFHEKKFTLTHPWSVKFLGNGISWNREKSWPFMKFCKKKLLNFPNPSRKISFLKILIFHCTQHLSLIIIKCGTFALGRRLIKKSRNWFRHAVYSLIANSRRDIGKFWQNFLHPTADKKKIRNHLKKIINFIFWKKKLIFQIKTCRWTMSHAAHPLAEKCDTKGEIEFSTKHSFFRVFFSVRTKIFLLRK